MKTLITLLLVTFATVSFAQESNLLKAQGNIRVNFMAFSYDLVANPLVTKVETKQLFKQAINEFKRVVAKNNSFYIEHITMDMSDVVWTNKGDFIVLDVKVHAKVYRNGETLEVIYTKDMLFTLKSEF